MSNQLFSGFASQHQESFYNKNVEELLFLISETLIICFRKKSVDLQRFQKKFHQIYIQLVRLELNKLAQPKYSESVQEITSYFIFDKGGCVSSQSKREDHQKQMNKFMNSNKSILEESYNFQSLKKEGISLTLSQRRSKSSFSKLSQQNNQQKEKNNLGNSKVLRNYSYSSIQSPKRNHRTQLPSTKFIESPRQKKSNLLRSSSISLQNDKSVNVQIDIHDKRIQVNKSAQNSHRAERVKNIKTRQEEYNYVNQKLLQQNKNIYSKQAITESKQPYLIQPHTQTINTSYNPTLESQSQDFIKEFNNIPKENNVGGKAYLDIYKQSLNVNIQLQDQVQENKNQIKINQKASLLRNIAAANSVDKKRSNSPYKLQNSLISKNVLIGNRRYSSYQSNLDVISNNTQQTQNTIQSRAQTQRGEPNKLQLNNIKIPQMQYQNTKILNSIQLIKEDRKAQGVQGGKKAIIINQNNLVNHQYRPNIDNLQYKENEQPPQMQYYTVENKKNL
ncbi:hypothetical protein TTHERM_00495930 (macronuclear) [Tetrahymena thermophila SB210]|uniref:Uncharacterized protein n=1 Tax=Tetrahymena thermophila (strain SB210) TaxID=312017 RepID=I7M4L7_TETTS|nr:hypothetical protein TTHERM_00495930 [Tetrahymena thermophila SB210]EAS07639.2 hypothetical protein TTHERM_00495930 [Tetrahymena thermophila SB210]|eukprot:XP_001027881.2 hypothetical protein TTHERM_00495930 [Tetrahymena thermophila SB210]